MRHSAHIVDRALAGRLVFFLGAGVNLCSRRPCDKAAVAGRHLPTGWELMKFLVERFPHVPQLPEDRRDLLQVASRVALWDGNLPLYESLQELFNREYPTTSVHRFIARVPAWQRAAGLPVVPPLVVTTNYDDLTERALQQAGEPFDVVYYNAEGDNSGRFTHVPHGQPERLIERNNDYLDLPINDQMRLTRTIVLKVHGTLDRKEVDRCSFVITEDDYLNFISRMDPTNPLPKLLSAALRNQMFLFLGYGLRDWNLRVILLRLWDEQKLKTKSCAVQLRPDDMDLKLWQRHNIEILDLDLRRYTAALWRQQRRWRESRPPAAR